MVYFLCDIQLVILTMYNIMSNQKIFIFVISVVLLFRGSNAFSSGELAELEKQECKMVENNLKFISQGQETNALVGWLVQERVRNARFKEEIGRLKEQKAQQEDLMKKIGVASYIRNKIEMYELILQNFPESAILRNLKSEPPELDTLDINLSDTTVKNSYYLHYNRWINILEHSVDPRIGTLREEVIKLFNTYHTFSRYIAQLFIHVSNITHNIPPDVLMWKNEDDVVQALHKWQINDALELTACRIVYRIPRMQSALPTNVGEKSLSTTSDGITPILKDQGAGNAQ